MGQPTNSESFFCRDHFCEVADRETARQLFKNSINIVVIELFSFCSRLCNYCPVSNFERFSRIQIH